MSFPLIKKTNFPFANRRFAIIQGIFLVNFSLFVFLALASFMHASSIAKKIEPISKNWMGSIGHSIAHITLVKIGGISGFLIPFFLLLMGYKLLFKREIKFFKSFIMLLVLMVWCSLTFGYYHQIADAPLWYVLPGDMGNKLTSYLESFLGGGVILVLTASMISFFIVFFNISPPAKEKPVKDNPTAIKKKEDEKKESEKLVPPDPDQMKEAQKEINEPFDIAAPMNAQMPKKEDTPVEKQEDLSF